MADVQKMSRNAVDRFLWNPDRTMRWIPWLALMAAAMGIGELFLRFAPPSLVTFTLGAIAGAFGVLGIQAAIQESRERPASALRRSPWLDLFCSPAHIWWWGLWGAFWGFMFFDTFGSDVPSIYVLNIRAGTGAMFLVHMALLICAVVRAIRLAILNREP